MEFKELSDIAVTDSYLLTYVNKIFSIWTLSHLSSKWFIQRYTQLNGRKSPIQLTFYKNIRLSKCLTYLDIWINDEFSCN